MLLISGHFAPNTFFQHFQNQPCQQETIECFMFAQLFCLLPALSVGCRTISHIYLRRPGEYRPLFRRQAEWLVLLVMCHHLHLYIEVEPRADHPQTGLILASHRHPAHFSQPLLLSLILASRNLLRRVHHPKNLSQIIGQTLNP